jgi:hypothetical protein
MNCLGLLASFLFPVIHLLLERLCLLLIGERQACQAVFKLESMEKRPVLIVGKGIVYLLIPDDSAVCWLQRG